MIYKCLNVKNNWYKLLIKLRNLVFKFLYIKKIKLKEKNWMKVLRYIWEIVLFYEVNLKLNG